MTENAKGGGNTQGGGSNEQPTYLTRADLDSVLGEFGKSIDQKIGGAVAGTIKKLDIGKAVADGIAAHEKARVEASGGGEDGAGGGGSKTEKVDPELVKIRRELDEQKKAFAKERDARIAAETSGRKKAALSDLTGSLAGKVRPEVASTLVSAWANEIAFDDDGNALMPLGDGTSTTIAAAVESRLKSKDYDWARPAPNNGGSGASGSRSSGTNGSPVNLVAARAKAPKDRTPAENDALYNDNLKRNAENTG